MSRAGGLALAFLVGACGADPEGDTRLTITFEIDRTGPTPSHLLLTWVGGGEIHGDDRRVPEKGTLPTQGPVLGTFEIEIGEANSWRTIVARGVGATGIVAEGAARVFALPGAATQATVRLVPGRLPDEDGDGIPDTVDNCRHEKNRGQGKCKDDKKEQKDDDKDRKEPQKGPAGS